MLSKEEREILSYASKDNFFIKIEDVYKKCNKTKKEVKEILESLYTKGLIDRYDDSLYYLYPYKRVYPEHWR